MRIRAAAIVILGLLAQGCLEMDTTHTLYLEPNGELSWSVAQDRIRSNDRDEEDRAKEEAEFLESAGAGSHPIANALRALAVGPVKTEVLRDRRPFSVFTAAPIGAADDALGAILRRIRLDGRVSLERDSEGCSLTVVVQVPDDDAYELEQDEPVLALLESPERYRIVLTEGRFVHAVGFDLLQDGAVAVPRAIEEQPPGSSIVWSLTWAP